MSKWPSFFTNADIKVLFKPQHEFIHGGHIRKYRLHIPIHKPDKIVVGLHGFTDSSLRFAYYTGLHNVVDDETLVVYPEGIDPKDSRLRRGWNASFCCGSGWKLQIDDIGFVRNLIKHLRNEFGTPKAKIYIAGFSNGAIFAQRLACEYPQDIRAVAAISGSIGANGKKLTPKRPVPILLVHGKRDFIVPFAGGTGKSDRSMNWDSFSNTQKVWLKINGGKPVHEDENDEKIVKTYSSDKNTKIIIYKNNGHRWQDWRLAKFWNTQPDGSQEIVDFFNSV